MGKKAIAYLDLMGFRAACDSALDDSLPIEMLDDENHAIEIAKADEKVKINDPKLKEIHEKGTLTSFEHYLPFSDSIFVVSNCPCKFVYQLSNFIINCICLSDGVDELNPVIFRGGLFYGDARLVSPKALINRELKDTYNLVGEGVVGAVHLEEMQKDLDNIYGPRILCDCEFVNRLCGKAKSYVGRCATDISRNELFWPMVHFVEDDSLDDDGCGRNVITREKDQVVGRLCELLSSAYELYNKHKSQERVAKHYEGFMHLLIASAKRCNPSFGAAISDTVKKIVVDNKELLQQLGINP